MWEPGEGSCMAGGATEGAGIEAAMATTQQTLVLTLVLLVLLIPRSVRPPSSENKATHPDTTLRRVKNCASFNEQAKNAGKENGIGT
ncbi:hypothetical protein E2C01_010001 [Portunus trituberculatus]|uniref:Uncharacterized protein n=1 Tax=Portunus trituberculatus TaxID=210409 RepID=A0A5B7D7B2_PORTR|nr:hypothetical protein [Portunus trituberculatus]